MAKPAGGKHPPNVTAVIITEDERRAKLAEAPPGSGGTGPGATVTSQIIPNTAEEHAQEMSDQLVGRAALICAKKLGVEFVWSTQTHKKITLDSAETLCRKNPGLIYFDFDALEDIAANLEKEERTLKQTNDDDIEGVEYVEGDEVADLSDPAVLAELEETAELEIDPDAEDPGDDLAVEQPPKRRLTREEQIARARSEAVSETVNDPPTSAHTITETERRAWGGTLSTPGMQVYIHPNGIARVDVQGRVKLQTGISGNVRIFRIQALERPSGGVVRNVTHTTVTGPKAPAQPPASTSRQMQSDRIPIPVPPKAELDDGTDY